MAVPMLKNMRSLQFPLATYSQCDSRVKVRDRPRHLSEPQVDFVRKDAKIL